MKKLLYLLVSLILLSCENRQTAITFDKYWKEQGAEILTYDIENNRYGQKRRGKAVYIFVTELFNAAKQVKADFLDSQKTALPILKLNRLTRFTTGIYDYSIMSSIFSVYNNSNNYKTTLKTTTSIQDWCGQIFIQINRLEDTKNYQLKQFSYFESAGDQQVVIKSDVILEDSLWTWLRLSPQTLPQGNVKLFPNSEFLRLNHLANKPYLATVTIEKNKDNENLIIKYNELNRQLVINFDKKFPHIINFWRDEMISKKGEVIENKGTLINYRQSPYWDKNLNKDISLRSNIKISPYLF